MATTEDTDVEQNETFTVSLTVAGNSETVIANDTATGTITNDDNAPPVITDPGDKIYEQGETITAFGVTVTDADGDAVTVSLTGLPWDCRIRATSAGHGGGGRGGAGLHRDGLRGRRCKRSGDGDVHDSL